MRIIHYLYIHLIGGFLGGVIFIIHGYIKHREHPSDPKNIGWLLLISCTLGPFAIPSILINKKYFE